MPETVCPLCFSNNIAVKRQEPPIIVMECFDCGEVWPEQDDYFTTPTPKPTSRNML